MADKLKLMPDTAATLLRCAFLRDVLFARQDELSSRVISKANHEIRRGDATLPTFFLQLPVRQQTLRSDAFRCFEPSSFRWKSTSACLSEVALWKPDLNGGLANMIAAGAWNRPIVPHG